MKVTIINHSDTQGGASIVSFRLMEALRALGVDARMLVAAKSTDSPDVEQSAPRWRARIPFMAEHLRIFGHNGFSRRTLFKVSLCSDGLPLSRHPLVESADAVALNWVNQGMLSLDEIGKIARMKPTLWTMHDQWNYTGICHHSGACERFTAHCGDCPFLGRMAGPRDLSYSVFNKKKNLYDTAPIAFVSISRWLSDRAARSALLADRRLEFIGNPFPVEALAEAPTLTRRQLGLPPDKRLVLFCAARIDDPDKGLPAAIEAINEAADTVGDFAAVFVGACRDPRALDTLRVPYVALGPVSPSKIPSLMAHSAAVISTSPFETHGATMVEAQAAGATPVCFTHDGRADIVEHGVTGYSLSADPRALCLALEKPIGREALRAAAMRYDSPAIAARYVDLIESLIGTSM